MSDAELVLDARAQLGEGPSWDAATGTLIWVDILAGAVHRFDPRSRTDTPYGVGSEVGAAVPRASGGLAVCRNGGIAALSPDGERLADLAAIDADRPDMWMNDAKCDPAGRLFAGTLQQDEAPGAGALYRLDPDLALTRVVDGVTCSNGIGWSPDGRTMYYVDSAIRRVDAFDYEPATAEMTNRRIFLQTDGLPQPDGLCVDEEGCLWIAFWDGWCLRRYTPDGRVALVVELPAARVTSCCFGGPDLTDLYVTTASPDEPDPAQPHAGGLFRLRPGVRGLPTHPFGG